MESLALKQQALSKTQENSRKHNKLSKQISKLHIHIANQRKDFLHKKSLEIANLYDLVCIEDLSIKEMCQDEDMYYRSYHRSVLDNGWYLFTQMLTYKLADRGKFLIKVGKDFLSTQLCNCCNYKNTSLTDLSIRKWVCPVCGTFHDRDENAALNIKKEGYRLYLESQTA